MKTKRLKNGIAKLKFNNNNGSMKNKVRKEAGRANVLRPIAPNKLKKADRFIGVSNATLGSDAVKSVPDTVKSVLDAVKSVPDTVKSVSDAGKSVSDAALGCDSVQADPRSGGVDAGTERAARKKKRSLSTPSVQKPSAKKCKLRKGDVEIFPSNDGLNGKKKIHCDQDTSTISIQPDPRITGTSLRTSLISNQIDNKSGVCSEQIPRQRFLRRSIDGNATEQENIHNIDETAIASTAASLSRNSTRPDRECDKSNLDQSHGDCNMTNPVTFSHDEYEEEDFPSYFSRSIRKAPLYTCFTGYCTVGKASKKLLVSMRPTNRLLIEGCYCIKPVLGRVRILGYTVHEGEKRAVFSPRHRALIPVTCVHEASSLVQRFSQRDSSQYHEEAGRSSHYHEEEGSSSQYHEEEGSSSHCQDDLGSCSQEEGERESGTDGQEECAPRSPPRPPSDGLGAVLTEERLESLRSVYGLDDSALTSLHLEIGAAFIVVELSSYQSKLPEVLHHIAVPSLLMDQQPERLASASLSFLMATTSATDRGPQSAVHYVHGTGQDDQDNLSSTDQFAPAIATDEECKPGTNESGGSMRPPSSDLTKALQEDEAVEHDTDRKSADKCEAAADAITGVGRPANTCDVNEWYSVLGGATPRILSMGQAPHVSVPTSWWQAVLAVKKEESEFQIGGVQLHPKRRVVIIGDKGAGKSTFLKYFINSLLDGFDEHSTPRSNSKSSSGVELGTGCPGAGGSAVCCLDLDPGQPEQSLPGSMSVCRYRRPLLGPAFTYSLATVTSNKELADRKKMFERRKKMVQQLLSLHGGSDSSGQSSKFMELTELLEAAETLEDQSPPGEVTKQLLLGHVSPAVKPHLYVDVVKELMETVRREHSDEALVVNTMGWLTELGITLLLDILKIVGPTHVIHLSSDGKPELDCDYMSHLFKEKQLVSVSTLNPIFMYDYLQVSSPASSAPVIRNYRKPPGPRDLRNLMFTSYFTALWPMDSTTSLDVTTCKIGVKLKYTDFAVYDLRFCDEPLAVLENMRQNKALVALCSTEKSNIFSAGKDSPKKVKFRPRSKLPLNSFFNEQFEEGEATEEVKRRISIRQNTEAHSLFKQLQQQGNANSGIAADGPKQVSTLENRIRDLKRTRRRAAFEVHGWAIVLGVDSASQQLHLLTPTPDTALPKTNTLVRCNVDLPKGFEKVLFKSFE